MATGELIGGAASMLAVAAFGAWVQMPAVATWVTGGLGGAFLVAALFLLVRQGRRQRFVHEVAVALPAGNELETGARLQAQLTLVPARDGQLLAVSTAWMLEETGLLSHKGAAQFAYEHLGPSTPSTGESLPMRAGEPLTVPLPLEVPGEASFHGRVNRLDWALRVRLRSGAGSEFLYRVPVTVRPPRLPG